MNFLKKITLLCVLCSVALTSEAQLVNGDWRVVGDNGVAIDNTTGLTWLHIQQGGTSGLTFNTVTSLLSTTYSGWRFASENEVTHVMNNMFTSPVAGTSFTPTAVAGLEWMSTLIGIPVSVNTYLEIGGLYNLNNGNKAFLEEYSGDIWYAKQALTTQADILNYSSANLGWYLVSDGGNSLMSTNNPALNQLNPNSPFNSATTSTAPVPLTGTMIGFGLLAMGLSRRQLKRV